MLHILRDYPCIAPIWSKLTNSLFPCDLGCDTIFAWLKAMVTHQHPQPPSNIPWSVTFPMVVWCIWSTRNKLVWEATSFDTDTILRKITFTATDLLHVLPSKHLSPTKPIHHIGWTLPSSGFFKLNTDGLAQGSPDCASAASIIRDTQDGGLRDGLMLAKKPQYLKAHY